MDADIVGMVQIGVTILVGAGFAALIMRKKKKKAHKAAEEQSAKSE